MKRIHMVLVLLVTVFVVVAAGGAPLAYAGEAGSIQVPDALTRGSDTVLNTASTPPGGDDAEGDPDSMGDGLSKDLNDSGASASSGGLIIDGVDITALEESLLYILSQIQILVL